MSPSTNETLRTTPGTSRIKGLEGCQTYGRSLHQARLRVREAAALALGWTATRRPF